MVSVVTWVFWLVHFYNVFKELPLYIEINTTDYRLHQLVLSNDCKDPVPSTFGLNHPFGLYSFWFLLFCSETISWFDFRLILVLLLGSFFFPLSNNGFHQTPFLVFQVGQRKMLYVAFSLQQIVFLLVTFRSFSFCVNVGLDWIENILFNIGWTNLYIEFGNFIIVQL